MTEEAREAVGDYKAGWHDPENSTIRFDAGLSEKVVRDISELKNEPEWMTEMRVKAFKHFEDRPMPTWGNMSMLKEIDFEKICYYLRSSKATAPPPEPTGMRVNSITTKTKATMTSINEKPWWPKLLKNFIKLLFCFFI